MPLLWLALCTVQASCSSLQQDLALSLRNTSASAVVLDWRSGSILSSVGRQTRQLPGSTLKPILLQYALQHNIILPSDQVYCRRNLSIGARQLPCTHPADQVVFTAQTALAESCNTYFAELGRRFSSGQLNEALRLAGLPHQSIDFDLAEGRELASLGLLGVDVSPVELARAYRRLALTLTPDGPVARGLEESVRRGMAKGASTAGISLLGKTGTAISLGQSWSNGWFAGYVPGRFVLVILVPHGDGGVAATLAHNFLSRLGAGGP